MPSLENLINAQIAEAPRLMMKDLIEEKLRDAGIPEGVLSSTADAVLRADDDSVAVEVEGATGDVRIAITEDDISNVMERANSLLEQIPVIINDTIRLTTRSMTRDLKKRWKSERWEFDAELDRFRRGVDARWGEAISSLELLLHLSRELGHSAFKKRLRSKHLPYKRDVTARLHVRACQVTDEIITLLKAGFADGAMARWRTLHEICVVLLLVSQAGDDLAQRYLEHEHVEVKAAIDEYKRNADELGALPPTDEELAEAAANFANVVAKYGSEFASPYGWAASYLKLRKPILSDLENAVEKGAMRSYYKMASYNVHASTRGVMFRLGSLGDSSLAIAGASNAGLDEPGRQTAFTLTSINSALASKRQSLEHTIELSSLVNIRDETVELFLKAAKRLERDERAALSKRNLKKS